MRFRQYQASARRNSTHLLWLYIIAVIAVAVFTAAATAFLSSLYPSLKGGSSTIGIHKPVFITVLILVITLITGAGWWRLRRLSAGGHVVAEALGGQRIIRAQAGFSERRLLNVAEEMAIASGVRLPKIYILPDDCLNAFAAGMNQRDAVIGITRGALDSFNRNELQAVVAHEFSHILNGDMRRNMQLCGALYGLQMITSLGRLFFDGDRLPISNRRGDNTNLPTALLGAILIGLGFAGSLAAGWIQAAISRQREYLADASAVQFTRQSDGLASALYKVATAPKRRLHSPHAAEYAHFMFEGVHETDIFDKLAATHPDIYDRITRLNPVKARRWEADIRLARSIKPDFYSLSSTGYFSDRHTVADTAADRYFQSRGQQLSAFLQRIDPTISQRTATLLQQNQRHWLNAEGDNERLLVVLTALFSPAALSSAAPEWQVSHPLRLTYYRRLQQHPLPQPLHRALLEYLLPSVAALPESEQHNLQNELNQLLEHHTLDAPQALLWLSADACLKHVNKTASTAEAQSYESVSVSIRNWINCQGKLDSDGRQNLSNALSALSTLSRRERAQLMEHTEQLLATNPDSEWQSRAAAVLRLYAQQSDHSVASSAIPFNFH